MLPPRHGEIRDLWIWQERANGRPMEAGVWHSPFPKDMGVGGEGYPVGTAAAVGNGHNSEPRQTLCLVLRDVVHGFIPVNVPFKDIKGGYQPEGAAHDLLHRDYPWQDNMLKVIAYDGGRLVRVYSWWYLVQRAYRWDQPVPGGPGKWLAQ